MLNKLSLISKILFFPVFFLVGYCNYLIFAVVPNEKYMGPVQRIFYFHVGSATACYVAIAVMFICSILYLANRDWKMDVFANAGAEVAFVFCSIVMASGMIWGHAAWGTWFSWEPRLVSFLLLWLILLAYLVLRRFADPGKVASHCAVLGILGAINVPIVVYSIKLLPRISQLHPQVVENDGLKHAMFKTTMFASMVSLILLVALLIILRSRLGFLSKKIGA